jgi:hypothetical protein
MVNEVDPFEGGEKVPSITWQISRGNDYPVGTKYTIELDEAPKKLQSRNYDTNEPDWWDDAKTQPKMSAVLTGMVLAGPQGTGEKRSVWANIPSNLFVGLKEAQTAEKFKKGSKVTIELVGTEPAKNDPQNKKNPVKLFKVTHEPVTAFGGTDAAPPF